MSLDRETHPIPDQRTLLAWVISPFYIIIFLSILGVFHPLLVLGKLFSHNHFLCALDGMCHSILSNLRITVGAKFFYSSSLSLPSDRPILVVANHQSMYDIPMLITLFRGRRPRFIAKRELARWIPSISYALRNNHSALIDRSDKVSALNAIGDAARVTAEHRGVLCLFPEGTRSRDGVGRKFKPGGFLTILDEMPDALVVPVAISRSWELLRYNLMPVPLGVDVHIDVFDPIDPAGLNSVEILNQVEETIKSRVKSRQQGVGFIESVH